jgi:hypothetical protein
LSTEVNTKKSQHFIPQGYLRKFTIEGEKSLLWQYDKQTCKKSNTPKSIKKICCRDFYYYQRDEQGKIDHIKLEEKFVDVENIGLKIIEKLKVENIPTKVIIGEEEQGQLAFFLALLLTRGPGFRDGINDLHGYTVQRTLKSLYEGSMLPDFPEILKERIKEKGIKNAIKVEIFSDVSLKPMIEMAQEISLEMLNKIWTFYIPYPGKTFISSDNPFSFGLAKGYPSMLVGPKHPYAEITIPLRKDLALVVLPSIEVEKEKIDGHHLMCFQATLDETQLINRRTAGAALNYVYSPESSDELLHLVKILKGTSQRFIIDGPGNKSFSIIKNPYVS